MHVFLLVYIHFTEYCVSSWYFPDMHKTPLGPFCHPLPSLLLPPSSLPSAFLSSNSFHSSFGASFFFFCLDSTREGKYVMLIFLSFISLNMISSPIPFPANDIFFMLWLYREFSLPLPLLMAWRLIPYLGYCELCYNRHGYPGLPTGCWLDSFRYILHRYSWVTGLST